jgi:cold shock CspA family protein
VFLSTLHLQRTTAEPWNKTVMRDASEIGHFGMVTSSTPRSPSRSTVRGRSIGERQGREPECVPHLQAVSTELAVDSGAWQTSGGTMPNGRLKKSFTDNGYTFIVPDDGDADVFLHVSRIRPDQRKDLFVGGARVEYEVEIVPFKGRERAQASNAGIAEDQGVQTASSVVVNGRRGSVKFWHPDGYGFLVDGDDGNEYYANGANVQGGYLRAGDQVQFDVAKEGDRTSSTNVTITGWMQSGDPYSDEIDLRNPNWVAQLAELAEKKEQWNYRIQPARDPFVILRSYIKYTYLRQRELVGHLALSTDKRSMAFNTGLVTDFQEEIFAVFEKQPDDAQGPTWRLKSFERASSGRFLGAFGGQLPPLASYYETVGQLVYDTKLPLRVNVEHVPHDPDRFPASLAAFTPEDLAGLVNARAPEAIERVRRNYKTAIPQFYRDSKGSGEGKMQLLLPVGLVRRDRVELALAVDRLESGVYLGRTVLTLDWAYNNARLITRPDTDWLQP